MEEVIKTLMRRDKLSYKEAYAEVSAFMVEAQEYIASGDSDGVEELIMEDLGLEPDYLEMLLPGYSFQLF